MARKRSIKPGYSDSIASSRLSFNARLLDILLWCHLDGNGMIEESPMSIKAKVFPLDDIPSAQVTVWITELIRVGRLFSLEVDGKRWLYRKNFRKEQKVYSDEPRKVLVKKEVLDQCDRGEYLTPAATLEVDPELDCKPPLFVTSPSSFPSTSTSPSSSVLNFRNGDNSEPLPPFNPPDPTWWESIRMRLRGAT